MQVEEEKLKYYRNFTKYKSGYRLVYFYDNKYEIANGIYAEFIKDFTNYLDKDIKNVSTNNLLKLFLKKNSNAIGAAIYSVDGTCICKMFKQKVNNNLKIYSEELSTDYTIKQDIEGYRIVYFYDNYYNVGEFSKSIEGFMIGFAKNSPIIDNSDIPKFISIDDLLNRYLGDMNDVMKVAIYKTNGECVAVKERKKNNKKSM